MYGGTTVGILGTVTIPNGTDTSNAMQATDGFIAEVLLHGRSVTDGAITYGYQTSPDGGATWYDLVDDSGTAIVPPLEGKSKRLGVLADYWRIKASGNVTADRSWDVTGEI